VFFPALVLFSLVGWSVGRGGLGLRDSQWTLAMAFMFKKRRTPKQAVDELIEALRGVSAVHTGKLKDDALPLQAAVWAQPGKLPEADAQGLVEVGKRLEEVRVMMCGSPDTPVKKEDAAGLSTQVGSVWFASCEIFC